MGPHEVPRPAEHNERRPLEMRRLVSRANLYERAKTVIHAGCPIHWQMTPVYDFRTKPSQWFLAPVPGSDIIKNGRYSYGA